jgi:hypothetical protein
MYLAAALIRNAVAEPDRITTRIGEDAAHYDAACRYSGGLWSVDAPNHGSTNAELARGFAPLSADVFG